MIRRPDNQSPEDENLRIKRVRIESVERNNEEEENCIPRIQNTVIDNHHNSPEAVVEIVGERTLENASEEEEDLSLFRALEDGSGSGHNTTNNDFRNNDRGTASNEGLEADSSSNAALTNHDEEPHTVELLSQTANTSSASPTLEAAPPATNPGTNSKEQTVDLTTDAIDLDAEEQQVLQISDDDFQEETKEVPKEYGAAKDYRCPICFEPPETALMTLCGHVFCCPCLFQMVNSSRTCRQFGHCALCRSKVYLKDVRLIILRKKQVKKKVKS
ncbi:SUMO-targeted ubiquitin ligase complex subunit SLX8 [Saccharomyces paradoxus]|uniref:SUMO-targeted ubiquitin ligase complex subunit SLX8 n=1 Tax=Saccharomyces paradoxus TaxID=27291 RepID=A0A8B8UQ92_SACPA|nr:Slx8 [Saccharomyces paradoxus]QHS72905.1 Slx8 [Saccharomyces paradoxus]